MKNEPEIEFHYWKRKNVKTAINFEEARGPIVNNVIRKSADFKECITRRSNESYKQFMTRRSNCKKTVLSPSSLKTSQILNTL